MPGIEEIYGKTIKRMMDEEAYIPQYLLHDVEEVVKHWGDASCTHFDCLTDELYGSINCAEVDGDISADDAWALRYEFLFDEENR